MTTPPKRVHVTGGAGAGVTCPVSRLEGALSVEDMLSRILGQHDAIGRVL